MYDDNYYPQTGESIAVNHWRHCHAPTVPLVTLYDYFDFPESIAINYRAPSHNSLMPLDNINT